MYFDFQDFILFFLLFAGAFRPSAQVCGTSACRDEGKKRRRSLEISSEKICGFKENAYLCNPKMNEGLAQLV